MKWIWPLLFLSLHTLVVFGQKKVKAKADFYKEVKHVNKEGVENGSYEMKTKKGRVLITGQFDNGKKVGIWKFNDRRGQPYLTYDFDQGEVLHSALSLQVKKGDKWITLKDTPPHSNQIGEYVYTMYKEFNYPAIAYKNGVEGIVMVAVELDKTGMPSNSKVIRDIGANLGKETLRLASLLTIQWDIPDDQHYRILIPMKFAIK
ncbi:MAG: energy transducer TonB [Bacteroidota bacterium]